MRIAKKNIFLFFFGLMLFGLTMALVNFIPYQGLWSKMKYPYLLWCMIDIIDVRDNKLRKNDSIRVIAIVLFSFTILFGFIFVNDIVIHETYENAKLVILYLVMLFSGYYEVNKYNCKYEMIRYAYYSVSLVMVVCFVANIGLVSWNPFFFLKSLFLGIRARTTFGLTHWNYVGLFGFICIVLSYYERRRYGIFKSIFVKSANMLCHNIIDIIVLFMINSCSSRAAISSCILFGILNLFFSCKKRLRSRKENFIVVFGVVLSIFVLIVLLENTYGLMSYIWNNSRVLNFSWNMPYFYELGKIWTGMGFVDNSGFQTSPTNNWISSFGVRTTSVDVYYLYIFFTTGIVGSIMIGFVLIYILVKLIKSDRSRGGNLELSLFITILYYSCWETILFTHKFWQIIPLLIVVFIQMDEKCKIVDSFENLDKKQISSGYIGLNDIGVK